MVECLKKSTDLRISKQNKTNQQSIFRSHDNSLAEPLDFYGPWVVLGQIGIWTMKCPIGYVSLGAIAEKLNWWHGLLVLKPDTSKYRCVDINATVVATPNDMM